MPDSSFILTLEATAFNMAQVDAQNGVISTRNESQIAFAGRSNVGKSTLVNTLANRRNLAKTSSVPGKTRSVNYYRVTNIPVPFVIADLPGYGYAQCPQTERNAWRDLMDHYLSDTPTLRAVALLLDCRLGPQQSDRTLAAFATSKGLTILPVLTKADKCNRADQVRRVKEWNAIIPGSDPVVVSSTSRQGLDRLKASLVNLCA